MQVEEKLKTLEEEITALHTVLEGRGINSRGATDIFGRPFSLPVNAEHKATVFNAFTLLSVAQPHMRVFWAATFGFFLYFLLRICAICTWPLLKEAQGGRRS